MRVLYLTNTAAEFSNFIPEALSAQGIKAITYTRPLHDDEKLNFDYIVSDRYPNKIPEAICKQFINRSLNLHSSLLPFFRGSYPILFAILHGQIPGWSIHRIDKRIDAGEILFQKKIYLDLKIDTLRTSWLRCQLEMMTHFSTNFLYFTKNNCFPEFKIEASNASGYFYFRKDLEPVEDLLTCGWETPVSEIFGLQNK